MKTKTIVVFRDHRSYRSTRTLSGIGDHCLSSVRKAALAASLCALLGASSPVLAQSCQAPGFFQPGPKPLMSDTTCGREQVSPTLCDDQIDNPGPNYVYQFVLHNPGGHLILTGEGSFNPSMFLSNSEESCTSSSCIATGDWVTPISFAGLPAGSYRLIIGASRFDSPGTCGAFTLQPDAEFYASEADYIFADGVD